MVVCRPRAAQLKAMVSVLLAAAVGACGGGSQTDEGAGAHDYSQRLGLEGRAGSPPLPGAIEARTDQLPAIATSHPPAFTPREEIVAAIKANRRKRQIPPDSALPKASARSEAELAAQTRAEMDNALKVAVSK